MKGFSDRIAGAKEYYFSKKLKEINEMISAGNDVINFGIGSPDLPPPQSVVDALNQASNLPSAHGYQSYRGIPELRKAMSAYYQKFFGVALDPGSEILPLNGSKEGIMHISMAFLNPGDEVLLPNPGYPTYAATAKLAQAKLRHYSMKENGPDLRQIEKEGVEKVKLMWINFPHMPTGQSPSKKLYQNLFDFAKRNEILLVNDNPYAHILTEKPLSLMQIKGAPEKCLELNSLSKSFNIAGWRVGMVSGAEEKIDSILKVKSNMDSGMFYGLQRGAIEALQSDESWFENLNHIYSKRKKLAMELASTLNLSFNPEQSGLFLWAKISGDEKSEEFTDRVLDQKNIFLTPGSIFGSEGESFIRISLCVPESSFEQAIDRIKNKS
ncbi:pyridoxal phosphate-dependent aminotransferase [Algoriphagus sediminis]|uniref:Aminotransferase n=1 Tax=Algoriphagus sediminis TaxID=3057113 RepID=A0ABT7Y899_9BACT|nr:aminotransferase class I/II-fold pyridoxal phosphate-dependent enzyme [Algoriphagus sediminis]MDN3202680.1 aminotransferase class I/II-fold pyridoxal phosphate-dependent enzyme [Algoriphagus sediminis]